MSLAGTSFTFQDANDDGKISKDEYYSTLSDAGVYSDWDLDNDGFINETEFDEVGFDYDFATWDVDDNNYLDAGEIYDSYYDTYDDDESGHWNVGEWDDAGDEGYFDV
ncbi:hypothetical protein NLU14_19530 [Marinobacter sp. 71-i]|uniref:EF-hand domain-containing protein n=1 Tax=Marinobacter iranensis TaxID=2962607 RepID=A0ABT5YFV7_9GAMM|nr:hypothetical protein [Marinobacter iranensis]MDF0752426.1 hypothetical protein [Marinobacter iranensis]